MPGPGSIGRLTAKVKASISGRRRSRSEPNGSRDGTGRPVPPPPPPEVDTSATGGIEVRYAPELDGRPDPGEVVWAWVPFEDDPTDGKDRPVLVIGFDHGVLAAVQLSSKDHSDRRDAGDWVEVGRGTWDSQARVSYADAGRLLRLDASTVRREGAILDRSRFDVVLDRVRTLHGWAD